MQLSLPAKLMKLYGWPRAARVIDEYKLAFQGKPALLRDLAMFCNVGAPIEGTNEFERGVEEGKRRVFLHVARMLGLEHPDFVNIADGRNERI